MMRFSLVAVAVLVLGATGCGNGSSGERVVASGSAGEGASGFVAVRDGLPESPSLPVVDDDGVAWFVSGGREGSVEVWALDRHGWSATLGLGVEDRPSVYPVVVPDGEGALVLTYVCEDSCLTPSIEVQAVDRDGDEVVASGPRWRSEALFDDAVSVPRYLGALDGRTLVGAGDLLLAIGGGPRVEVVALAEGSQRPCPTPGSGLVAPVIRGTEDQGDDIEGSPGDVPPVGVEVSLVQLASLDSTAWEPVDGSTLAWRDVYEPGADFRCGSRGIEYGFEEQLSSWVWDGAWREADPEPVDWLLVRRSVENGVVGVVDGEAVVLDTYDGSTVASVPVPDEVMEYWSAPVVDQPGPGGTLAVGGSEGGPAAVACWGETEERACGVF